MPKRVLVAEPDNEIRMNFQQAAGPATEIIASRDFVTAREWLLQQPPDILVTNVRLGAYNGLHLIYLAGAHNSSIRTIVYAGYYDLSLIAEAQRAKAFFEPTHRVVAALPSYLVAALPEYDRRTVQMFDRRREYRGGRRAADAALLT